MKVISAIERRDRLIHCSLNALKVAHSNSDEDVRKLVEEFDLVTPDGMSIVWGLRITLGVKTRRVPGVEVMFDLLEEGAKRKWSIFFLGGTPEVSRSVKSIAETQFRGLRVVGAINGFYDPREEAKIVRRIRDCRPDILFVGMPSPRKERFLVEHRDTMDVPFSMGVGGGLDLLAGKTKRAPGWMQRSGLEWLYRVHQEPGRLSGRYFLSNCRFAGILIREMFQSREKSC